MKVLSITQPQGPNRNLLSLGEMGINSVLMKLCGEGLVGVRFAPTVRLTTVVKDPSVVPA